VPLNYKLQITNYKLKGLCFLAIVASLLFLVRPVFAVTESDCLTKNANDLSPDDLNDCINNILPRITAAYAPAQQKNKSDLASLNKQLSDLSSRITSFSTKLASLAKQISSREVDLAYTKELFNEKAKNHYTFLRLYDPITPFIYSDSASDAFREIILRQKAADEDRKIMEGFSQNLNTLREDKANLEKNKVSLSALQVQVSEKQKFLAGEVAKVDTYLGQLSAKQQELLAAKSGSFIASVGDSELADDPKASIKGFRDSAPSGSFAVFSFGGYTHRKGMSQYGARGRAQAGKNASDILKAYFGKTPVSKDTGGTISVTGVGNVNFEDYYLMGIAEMPSSWHPEALKAQAIAARTYAYRYKVDGKQICTTEACQVFRKSKADNTPAEWKQAVQATRGQVLEDVVTYYSSTSGGYSTTSGWDTTDGAGGANFFDKSYEKVGGSPWAYKAWYRKGYTASGETCGESDPWLTNEEFTDMVNAAIVLKNESDGRVTSRSTSCWGGNPYTMEEMRQKGGVSSVTSVQVMQGTGVTNEVVVNGTVHLSGAEFKQGFNLRAPGYLMIPQKGFAFFNIEKK
jgi:peptidoglycan hydrolase CwlO-like protein